MTYRSINWKFSLAIVLLVYTIVAVGSNTVPVSAAGCPVTVAKESIFADVTITAWKIIEKGKRPKIEVDVSIQALHGQPALPGHIKVVLTAYYNPNGCELSGFQEYLVTQNLVKSHGRQADAAFRIPGAPNPTGNGAYMFKVVAYDGRTGIMLGFHIVDPREGTPSWG